MNNNTQTTATPGEPAIQIPVEASMVLLREMGYTVGIFGAIAKSLNNDFEGLAPKLREMNINFYEGTIEEQCSCCGGGAGSGFTYYIKSCYGDRFGCVNYAPYPPETKKII